MASHTSAFLSGAATQIVATGSQALTQKFAALAINVRDEHHGGDGRISGNVSIDASPTDIPVVRRVRLHRKVDGMLIREQWSSSSGAYAFENIMRAQNYYVVSFDHTGAYEAVIRDSVAPELMP